MTETLIESLGRRVTADLKRLPNGTFAPKGRGQILRPGMKVHLAGGGGRHTVHAVGNVGVDGEMLGTNQIQVSPVHGSATKEFKSSGPPTGLKTITLEPGSAVLQDDKPASERYRELGRAMLHGRKIGIPQPKPSKKQAKNRAEHEQALKDFYPPAPDDFGDMSKKGKKATEPGPPTEFPPLAYDTDPRDIRGRLEGMGAGDSFQIQDIDHPENGESVWTVKRTDKGFSVDDQSGHSRSADSVAAAMDILAPMVPPRTGKGLPDAPKSPGTKPSPAEVVRKAKAAAKASGDTSELDRLRSHAGELTGRYGYDSKDLHDAIDRAGKKETPVSGDSKLGKFERRAGDAIHKLGYDSKRLHAAVDEGKTDDPGADALPDAPKSPGTKGGDDLTSALEDSVAAAKKGDLPSQKKGQSVAEKRKAKAEAVQAAHAEKGHPSAYPSKDVSPDFAEKGHASAYGDTKPKAKAKKGKEPGAKTPDAKKPAPKKAEAAYGDADPDEVKAAKQMVGRAASFNFTGEGGTADLPNGTYKISGAMPSADDKKPVLLLTPPGGNEDNAVPVRLDEIESAPFVKAEEVALTAYKATGGSDPAVIAALSGESSDQPGAEPSSPSAPEPQAAPSSMPAEGGGLQKNTEGIDIGHMQPGTVFEMNDGTQFKYHKPVNAPFHIVKPLDGGKAKPLHEKYQPPMVGSLGSDEGSGAAPGTPSAPPAGTAEGGDLYDTLKSSVDQQNADIEKMHSAGMKSKAGPQGFPSEGKSSPGRGPSGKMRNFKAMNAVKLNGVIAELEKHAGDPEALAAAKAALANKS